MIEVKQLTKAFSNHLVLSDISTTFTPGSIYGLIGINGAGKSTLLRLLSGILLPDQGTVLIDDEPVYGNETAKKKVFYLSDQLEHSGLLSLNDLKALYAVFYDFDETIYNQIIAAFQLNPKARLSTLSKGMKRQGMLAIAFATQVKYLLLDEVFDGLDPASRMTFKKMMITFQNEDKVILLTSHSLRELEDICDTFGMIDETNYIKYEDLALHMSQVVKYQIILNHSHPITLNKAILPYYYFEQNGRVVSLICERQYDLASQFNLNDCLAIDEHTLSFEEYFILMQEVKKK